MTFCYKMIRLFIKNRLQSVFKIYNKLEDAVWILYSSKLQLNGKSLQSLFYFIRLVRDSKTVFFTSKIYKSNL